MVCYYLRVFVSSWDIFNSINKQRLLFSGVQINESCMYACMLLVYFLQSSSYCIGAAFVILFCSLKLLFVIYIYIYIMHILIYSFCLCVVTCASLSQTRGELSLLSIRLFI